MNKVTKTLGLAYLSTFLLSAANASGNLDQILDERLKQLNVYPVTKPLKQDANLVELGKNLFFEKEWAGRRNISCSTCHSPVLGSADAQSQSRGQGAIGLGPHRRQNQDEFFQFLPRNTLSLWNRGVEGWDTMFWDGRLGESSDGSFFSPAGSDTPQNFTNALAAFSIIPVTPDEEMRGFPGQLDVFGNVNELADPNITNDDFAAIWPLVTARITNHPGYSELLMNAFPYTNTEDITIVELSEALGAFMTESFTALESDFDQYLSGDKTAMSDQQKKGAILFYGEANCSRCHSGALQTDFGFHNIAAPQVGTGRGASADVGLDLGRGAITNRPEDNFKFRTPSLRNIEIEAPYFHNGAYANLRDAVEHHINPLKSWLTYENDQIEPELSEANFATGDFTTIVEGSPLLFQKQSKFQVFQTLSKKELFEGRKSLTKQDVDDIMAFLSALTDPNSLNQLDLVPDSLPSGLTLAD